MTIYHVRSLSITHFPTVRWSLVVWLLRLSHDVGVQGRVPKYHFHHLMGSLPSTVAVITVGVVHM